MSFLSIPDLIGLGIAALGILIFLIFVFSSKSFRQYAGIREYKEGRDKLSYREEEPEEEYVPEPREGFNLAHALGKIVGLVLTLYVGNEVISAVGESTNIQNVTSPMLDTALAFIPAMLPIFGLVTIGSIVIDFFNWKKDADAKKEDYMREKTKGIREYKKGRKKVNKSRRKKQ